MSVRHKTARDQQRSDRTCEQTTHASRADVFHAFRQLLIKARCMRRRGRVVDCVLTGAIAHADIQHASTTVPSSLLHMLLPSSHPKAFEFLASLPTDQLLQQHQPQDSPQQQLLQQPTARTHRLYNSHTGSSSGGSLHTAAQQQLLLS